MIRVGVAVEQRETLGGIAGIEPCPGRREPAGDLRPVGRQSVLAQRAGVVAHVDG